jgi:hypothetical protein
MKNTLNLYRSVKTSPWWYEFLACVAIITHKYTGPDTYMFLVYLGLISVFIKQGRVHVTVIYMKHRTTVQK